MPTMIAGHEAAIDYQRSPPGGSFKIYRLGTMGQRARVQVWFLGRLTARDGTDCGPYIRVKDLPVSPRHHGGVGVGRTQDGRLVFLPTAYTDRGYRRMEDLEKTYPNWRELNAEAEARKAKLEAEKGLDGGRMVASLIEIVRQMSGGHLAADLKVPDAGGSDAEAASRTKPRRPNA